MALLSFDVQWSQSTASAATNFPMGRPWYHPALPPFLEWEAASAAPLNEHRRLAFKRTPATLFLPMTVAYGTD